MRLRSMAHPILVKPPLNTFPGLYAANDGTVILMSTGGKGMVVSCREGAHYIGQYSDHWSMDSFKAYEGSVTVQWEKEEEKV